MSDLTGKWVVFAEESPSGDIQPGVPYLIQGVDADGDYYVFDDAGDRNFYPSNPDAKFTIQGE